MAKPSPPLRFAALDVGSLTVRLAVAERLQERTFRVLVLDREVTGLGEGLSRTGELAPTGMTRTLKALGKFVEVMASRKVAISRAVGTQALRQAGNRQVFLDRVRQDLGITVQVLAPEEEARFSLSGVLSALAPEYAENQEVLVFDVGGGSTEWALIAPGRQPVFASLPLGVLTLSQAWRLGDPPQASRLAALKQELARQLRSFYAETLRTHLAAAPRLVGTAGAVTTLAAMSLEMQVYDPQKINNLILPRVRVEQLADLVGRLPEAERARLPGMEPAKARVMVAGALMVLTILQVLEVDSLVIIDAGLLEGVLQEMICEFSVSRFC